MFNYNLQSTYEYVGGRLMLYADKIMNTERYKELKDVGNKIAKKYQSTKFECSILLR